MLDLYCWQDFSCAVLKLRKLHCRPDIDEPIFELRELFRGQIRGEWCTRVFGLLGGYDVDEPVLKQFELSFWPILGKRRLSVL